MLDLILRPDDPSVIRIVENWNSGTDLDAVRNFNKLVFCGVWHNFDPKIWKERTLIQAFEKYVNETEPEKRIVILENFRQVKERDNYEEAVEWDGEVGGMYFEARNRSIPTISGDLIVRDITHRLNELGFTAEEVAVFFVLQNTWAHSGYRGNLANKIHFFITECGANLMSEFSDTEIQMINDFYRKEEREDLLLEHSLVNINKKTEEMCGIVEMFDLKSGETKLKSDELKWLCYPPDRNGKILTKIMYFYLQIRDQYLFEKICEQVGKGKRPFVVYGLNHLVRLMPALEFYDSGAKGSENLGRAN